MNSQAADLLGMAHLGRRVFEGADLGQIAAELTTRATAEPPDAGAVHDLGTLYQMLGQREQGLALQQMALETTQLFRIVHGTGQGLRILALMAPGDLMANTPIDFMLEGSDAELLVHFAQPDAMLPWPPPEHDVAMVAVSESDENLPTLVALSGVADAWPTPVVNAQAERIAGLSRDGVAKLFEGDARVLAPAVLRASRSQLETLTRHADGVAAALGSEFPVIVRPVGSHAGRGLERLTAHAELAVYLAAHPEPDFFISPFIDYSGPDGLFRKLRIALIDGRPYISHLAISEHWMVHYLNAGMDESEAKRAEEAEMMAGFDTGFARRHAAGFAALCEKIGLDYFAIDCAELADGRLLLFEADVAMIVHSLDPEDRYPYKKPAMEKLFAAFLACLSRIAGRTS